MRVNGETPITVLLQAWTEGDRKAFDQPIPMVYSELRRLAAYRLRNAPGNHTIEPTMLVHEAWLRFAASNEHNFVNRAHFFGVAARVMRIVLVDRARARNASKRGGVQTIALNLEIEPGREWPTLVTSLDDALSDLERQDPGKARILELRYFGGLTAEESSEVLGLTVHQINRQIRLAQAWLRRAMGAGDGKKGAHGEADSHTLI